MTAPPVTLQANAELVAAAWIAGIAGITSDMVAGRLPKDPGVWAATGFVTVAVVGGTPVPGYALRQPVIRAQSWATKPGSNKPPWGMSAHLIELIVNDTWSPDGTGRDAARDVTLPHNYPPARVKQVWPEVEPRRAYGDLGDYASHVVDLQFVWHALPERTT